MTVQKIKLVVSDLHMGTGVRKGMFNPLEEFYEDERFAEWLNYYSQVAYPDIEIELILNGDIFDLLKIPLNNRWIDEITPEISAEKMRLCLSGHPIFCQAIKEFLERKDTKLTIIPGNHDFELVLPQTQKVFLEYCATSETKDKVQFITKTDTYYLPEGIQIRHGHCLEATNRTDMKKPLKYRKGKPPILKLSWGAIFVLKVLAPAKFERYHIDHIYPLARLLWAGLIFDFRFSIKIVLKSIYYFIKSRLKEIWSQPGGWRSTWNIIKEEFIVPLNFDQLVEREIKKVRGVHTFIFGHSHMPRCKVFPDGKLYINTGTWIRMINLDLHHLGQKTGLTYALIEYEEDNIPRTTLMRWIGEHRLTEKIYYEP